MGQRRIGVAEPEHDCMKHTNMKRPNYLAHELHRRLAHDAPAKEILDLLSAIGMNADEPGPAPDLEAIEELYDAPCRTGSSVIDGTLDFLGHRTPLHFRISYAGLINDDQTLDMLAAPAMLVDLLNWQEREPNWVQVDTSILSESMIENIWPAISLHASQTRSPQLSEG